MPPKGGAKAGKGKPAEKTEAKLKPAQQIKARHILCEKHAKKEKALEQLQSGVSFDKVAREFSEDKAKLGGACDWAKRADLLPEFATVAFELPASEVGAPKYAEAKTVLGYHIIMVDDRK